MIVIFFLFSYETSSSVTVLISVSRYESIFSVERLFFFRIPLHINSIFLFIDRFKPCIALNLLSDLLFCFGISAFCTFSDAVNDGYFKSG